MDWEFVGRQVEQLGLRKTDQQLDVQQKFLFWWISLNLLRNAGYTEPDVRRQRIMTPIRRSAYKHNNLCRLASAKNIVVASDYVCSTSGYLIGIRFLVGGFKIFSQLQSLSKLDPLESEVIIRVVRRRVCARISRPTPEINL